MASQGGHQLKLEYSKGNTGGGGFDGGHRGGGAGGGYQEAKKKRVRAATTQPSSLVADAFAAVLAAIPADDLWRTWAADRTMMLRTASKRFKTAVDKLRPPTSVKLSRTFWDNVRNGTEEKRRQHILTHLEKMTSRCSITTLQLLGCGMSCQDAGRLAGVLTQSLSALYLFLNQIGDDGVGILAVVLPQCRALSVLDLGGNQIGDEGAGRLSIVLPQCPALSELYLFENKIGDQGAGRLAEALPQCPALSSLDVSENHIGAQGVSSLRASWRGGALDLVLDDVSYVSDSEEEEWEAMEEV